MTELPDQLDDLYPEAARRFLDEFRMRHSAEEILDGLEALRNLRVLVVGEAIIDEYSYCTPLGKSPKEAIISAKHVRREHHAGGALACANHVGGFCDDVELVTGLGGLDTQEQFIRDRLKPNVKPRFFIRQDAPTITKRRYIWEPFLLKMFEVVIMDDAPMPLDLEDQMLGYLDKALPGYDLVMVADYGHGLLSQRAAAALAGRARFLAVNTQANAGNLGFNLITKYPRASYVCIDEAEMRLAMHDRWSPVAELADKVRAQLGGPAISVTRGQHGALTCGEDGMRWEIPVFSRDVVDRMGAGDAYLAVTSPCVASGMPMDVVGLLGNAVGALAVRIVGNRTSVDSGAVHRFVRALLK